MRNRRGLPRPLLPPTHIVFLVVFFGCVVFFAAALPMTAFLLPDRVVAAMMAVARSSRAACHEQVVAPCRVDAGFIGGGRMAPVE